MVIMVPGHGVGAALNVHEGPQSISTRYYITTPLQVRQGSCTPIATDDRHMTP
jgi:Xaa-Pro aminopeptidase